MLEDMAPPADIICDRSTLQAYAECPWRAALSSRSPREVTSPLPVAGTLIHELIEEAFDACDKQGIAEVADYFVQEVPKTRPDIQPEVLQAAKWVANYLLQISPVAIIGYEKQLNHVLFPSTHSRGAVRVTACADLVMYGDFGGYDIWDWKTGWKHRSKTDAQADFQAQMLAWLWWQNVPDAMTVSVTFIETRTGGKSTAEFRRDAYMDGKRTLTQEAAIGARIAEATRLLLAGAEEAWPSAVKCAQCDYVDQCKHADWAVAEIATDPASFLNSYHVCREIQKRRHAMISEWLKAGKTLTSKHLAARVKTKPSRFTWEIK